MGSGTDGEQSFSLTDNLASPHVCFNLWNTLDLTDQATTQAYCTLRPNEMGGSHFNDTWSESMIHYGIPMHPLFKNGIKSNLIV